MSDFRYLDYEGLATYTEHVKGYADGKVVYLSDESEIPDPPKEGTLYVIGSEILMDEEIIIGTQTDDTSSWIGKSIDTRLHNGKRIAYYLPYPSVAGVPSSLTLELSDEDNTITPAIRIIVEGGYFNRVIPGGSVIRMTYFESVMMNGVMGEGWICDGNIIQNNVTYTGTLVDEQVATFEGSTGTIKASGYTIAKSVPSSAVFTDTKNTAGSTDSASKLYLIGATSQAANPQTYSNINVYAEDGDIYANNFIGNASSANRCQYYNYGNIYSGTISDTMPSSLTLPNDSINLIDGGRVILVFNNNGVNWNSGKLEILKINNINIIITHSFNSTTGYTRRHSGLHIIDIVLHRFTETWYAYIINGFDSEYATNATNATNVNISTSLTSTSYPLVFTSNVTAGNKPLYTDTVNSLYYNPSLNTLTVPTASVSTIRHPSAADSTSYSIQFSNPVKLYNYSNAKGTFNVKGSNHESEGIILYGGSSSGVAKLTVNGINGSTTTRGNITCGQLTYTGGSLGTSDERLKNFENDIEIDFNKLKEIPKKYFTWKYDEDKVINLGTSAQEVEKIYPEIVGEYVDESTNIKYKSLDYSKLSIIALAAIDKLNERIEYLENKLKEYEK